MESNTRKGGIHVSFSTNSVFWFWVFRCLTIVFKERVVSSCCCCWLLLLLLLVVVVVVGCWRLPGFSCWTPAHQNAPCPSAKTHLPNAEPYAVRDPNRWRFHCWDPGNFLVDLFAGNLAGFQGIFCPTYPWKIPQTSTFIRTSTFSLRKYPKLPPFHPRKETSSESVGEGSRGIFLS